MKCLEVTAGKDDAASETPRGLLAMAGGTPADRCERPGGEACPWRDSDLVQGRIGGPGAPRKGRRRRLSVIGGKSFLRSVYHRLRTPEKTLIDLPDKN